jgi:hypothetical protein
MQYPHHIAATVEKKPHGAPIVASVHGHALAVVILLDRVVELNTPKAGAAAPGDRARPVAGRDWSGPHSRQAA